MYYPKHAGFPLGEIDSPKYVVLETHYDNPLAISGKCFRYFKKKRNFEVTTFQFIAVRLNDSEYSNQSYKKFNCLC